MRRPDNKTEGPSPSSSRCSSRTLPGTPRVASTTSRILVVGAGVAGLQAARALLRHGFKVVILEENDTVGGVWSRNYQSYSLQVPFELYRFLEYPVPRILGKDLSPAGRYPSGPEVLRYIKAYAQAFDLARHVRFCAKLEALTQHPATATWTVRYRDLRTGARYEVQASYVVMATGMYSTPNIPRIKGQDGFQGLQVHCKDFTSAAPAQGRRVLILGNGKSALDCTVEMAAGGIAKEVALVYRRERWPFPRQLGGKSVKDLLYHRGLASVLPPYYNASVLNRLGHAVLYPYKRLFWSRVQKQVFKTFRLTREQMNPSRPLDMDLFHDGQVVDEMWPRLIRHKACKRYLGKISHFKAESAVLEDGRVIRCDLVLYCTGYHRSYAVFDDSIKEALGLGSDGLYLYRHVLPPHVRNLAFVGSETNTFNNILTSGLQAEWLAAALSGRMALPPPEAMDRDILLQQRWAARHLPNSQGRAGLVMLHQQYYYDQIMADLGLRARRKDPQGPCLSECLQPYTALDYWDVPDEVMALRPRAPPAQLCPVPRGTCQVAGPDPSLVTVVQATDLSDEAAMQWAWACYAHWDNFAEGNEEEGHHSTAAHHWATASAVRSAPLPTCTTASRQPLDLDPPLIPGIQVRPARSSAPNTAAATPAAAGVAGTPTDSRNAGGNVLLTPASLKTQAALALVLEMEERERREVGEAAQAEADAAQSRRQGRSTWGEAQSAAHAQVQGHVPEVQALPAQCVHGVHGAAGQGVPGASAAPCGSLRSRTGLYHGLYSSAAGVGAEQGAQGLVLQRAAPSRLSQAPPCADTYGGLADPGHVHLLLGPSACAAGRGTTSQAPMPRPTSPSCTRGSPGNTTRPEVDNGRLCCTPSSARGTGAAWQGIVCCCCCCPWLIPRSGEDDNAAACIAHSTAAGCQAPSKYYAHNPLQRICRHITRA